MMYSWHFADDKYVDFFGYEKVRSFYKNKAHKKLFENLRKKMADEYNKKITDDSKQPLVVINNVLHMIYPTPFGYSYEEVRKVGELDDTQIKQLQLDLQRKGKVLDFKNMSQEEINKRYINTDVEQPCDKMMVVITEAPTYSFLDWCSRMYQTDVNNGMKIMSMMETGYHTDDVWYSIIFQTLAALQVMYNHKFAFTGADVTNHLYVKDLGYMERAQGFYHYIVDGIDYFIPNHGSLLMIDPAHKDIDVSYNKAVENKYIVSEELGDGYEVTRVFVDNLMNLTDFNKLDNGSYRNQGVVPPSDNVKALLNKIKIDLKDLTPAIKKINSGIPHAKDLHTFFDKEDLPKPQDIIRKNFGMFLHNKVGNFIKGGARSLVDPREYNFKRGDVVAYLDPSGSYKWGIVEDKKIKPSFGIGSLNVNCEIITDYNEIRGRTVNSFSMYDLKVYNNDKYLPLKIIPSKIEGQTSRIWEVYNVDK